MVVKHEVVIQNVSFEMIKVEQKHTLLAMVSSVYVRENV